ncbi:MAG: dTDP-4-dehydrorhamnose reductase [Myxococcota bacterium]
MKILLVGASGQLGQALSRTLPAFGAVSAPPRTILDLARPNTILQTLDRAAPDLIVNAAAYTAVDAAETDQDAAMAINADGPGHLARWARQNDAAILHYSTDYVFDGSGERPWAPGDPIHPLNVYGQTKAAGEQQIRDAGARHTILRTSWLYGPTGHNFLRSMLRLGQTRDVLRVVADQIGAPTTTAAVAAGTARLLRIGRHHQTLHLCCQGAVSWHGFAVALLGDARARGWPLTVREVIPIRSEEYPTPATRPRNSRLSIASFVALTGWRPPTWQDAMVQALDRLHSRR